MSAGVILDNANQTKCSFPKGYHMEENNNIATKATRQIPHDKTIKLVLLAFHLVGFSAWYGTTVLVAGLPVIFPIMAVVSGILLTVRELYKKGRGWLRVTEGVLTWAKVILLGIGYAVGQYEIAFLSIVLIFGLLSSHLPSDIKHKKLIGYQRQG